MVRRAHFVFYLHGAEKSRYYARQRRRVSPFSAEGRGVLGMTYRTFTNWRIDGAVVSYRYISGDSTHFCRVNGAAAPGLVTGDNLVGFVNTVRAASLRV